VGLKNKNGDAMGEGAHGLLCEVKAVVSVDRVVDLKTSVSQREQMFF